MGIDPSRLGADVQRQLEAAGIRLGFCGRKFKARPTERDGIRFPSQTQARVYERVRAELRDGDKLMLDARLPLVAIAPICGRASKGGYLTVDFTIWRLILGRWTLVRAIDAKPAARAARSRDWRRGAAAFLATYQIEIEEWS